MVQRPGRRPGRGGDLRPRRRHRARCGARPRCRSASTESTYVARHGPGYSRFEHVHDGIAPRPRPVRAARRSGQGLDPDHREPVGRTRRLSVTAYAEWVLGTSRGASARPHRERARAGDGGAPRPQPLEHGVRRPGRVPGPGRTPDGVDGRSDRVPRSQRRPRTGRRASSAGTGSRGAVGAGMDPCAALQTTVELAPGARTEVRRAARRGGRRPRRRRRSSSAGGPPTTRRPCGAVRTWWDDVLGTVQVRTPDRSMDIMLNTWLLYQALSCRLWAQDRLLPGRRRVRVPGPAPGRRRPHDRPAASSPREHLLRAAARQFPEGDVQHWWHPPSGRGVRTRISDDRLWLPYAVDRYVAVTGDAAVLDEDVPFIDGPLLRPDQVDALLRAGARGRDAPRSSSTAPGPSTRSLAVGRPRPAADRVGRLERRHEPGRPRGPRRERLAGLVPPHGDGRVRPDRGGARRSPRGPSAGGRT